jgi:hypothetical protein
MNLGVRRLDDRRVFGRGGKSGLHWAARRLTAGGRFSKDRLRKVAQKIYRRISSEKR